MPSKLINFVVLNTSPMKKIVFFSVLASFCLPLQAQFLKDLKKAATDKAKELNTKENREKLLDAGLRDIEKARAEFDSTDFDYAILMSDNSGSFEFSQRQGIGSRVSTSLLMAGSMAKNDGLTDADYARMELEKGELSYGMGWYNSADKRFTEAVALYEKASLTADIGYLKSISNLGLLYTMMGRYTLAEEFTQTALDKRIEKLGKNNAGLATSYNNFGVLKSNQSHYNEAEKYFDDALSLLNANGFGTSMQFVIASNNKAMLFQTIGRYEEAEKIMKEILPVAEKNLKQKNYLKFVSNLALLYQQMGKYNDAEAIYLSMEKKLGKSSLAFATMLNNQAALYIVMGKEDKVEDLLKRSASIFKSNLGEESPPYAKVINDLGNFYRYKERYAEAEQQLNRALAIRESLLGKNHPNYVQSMEDIAILHWKKKAWDKAFMTYRDVMDKSLEFINKYFPPMSEAEKTKYWDILQPRFQRFYNFALEANLENPRIVDAMFDYQIATKALLLSSTNKVKQLILSSKDAALIKDYRIWLDQKEKLARLYAYSRKELEEQKVNLDSLERASNAMEKKLSERSADFSAGYSVKKTSFSTIKTLLGDTEAVVEVMRLQKFTQKFTEDVNYVALVLAKASEGPKLVVLDNGLQLETRYSKYYRNAVQQKIADEYSYDQYWSRIDTELAGKKLIYFSPDGVYSQLNVNTLRKPNAEYVLNRYDVVVLGNSKDLVAIKAKKARVSKKAAALIGFPDYGAGNIAPLPGTKTEMDGISKALKAAAYQVTMFSQKTATEANLKALKGPAIVHIATHGYFLKDAEHTGSAFGVHMENADDNPLLRSGLMLAGAASTASGKRVPNLESNDNGVLTAYEAMSLNFDGVDLVVLSACETGLGDVKAGEGVYGLQRAFLVAGADALIMSLWKVDDAATQQLMNTFYTNWIKLGNKQKAFKQAQLSLMTKYKDPYYWGAFVMMGL